MHSVDYLAIFIRNNIGSKLQHFLYHCPGLTNNSESFTAIQVNIRAEPLRNSSNMVNFQALAIFMRHKSIPTLPQQPGRPLITPALPIIPLRYHRHPLLHSNLRLNRPVQPRVLLQLFHHLIPLRKTKFLHPANLLLILFTHFDLIFRI